MRIASLLPSATEIVCALGAADELVGISHECDYPPSIRDRPALTRTRIDPHATSAQIDAAVRVVLRDALSIYDVDHERLAALAPDVIITQDLCEVCAVSLTDVRAALTRIVHRDDIALVTLSPTRLADVLGDIDRVAAAIGRPSTRPAAEARFAAIAARAASAPRLRVVSLEWIDPIMLGGTWMPEIIELAGGIAVGASAGGPAPTVTAADIAAMDPDVIVVKPCGFTTDRTLREVAIVQRAIGGLRARTYITDGNAYFNRPGPRLVESTEIMAACIHPDRFPDFAATHAASIIEIVM